MLLGFLLDGIHVGTFLHLLVFHLLLALHGECCQLTLDHSVGKIWASPDVVLSQICVGSQRDVELQAKLNHHLLNLFRQLGDHVEAGILNRLLHGIVDPARSVGHHVERILDFDWDVVCPSKSRFPTVDPEDVGNVTSKLKVSLRCNLLVSCGTAPVLCILPG